MQAAIAESTVRVREPLRDKRERSIVTRKNSSRLNSPRKLLSYLQISCNAIRSVRVTTCDCPRTVCKLSYIVGRVHACALFTGTPRRGRKPRPVTNYNLKRAAELVPRSLLFWKGSPVYVWSNGNNGEDSHEEPGG